MSIAEREMHLWQLLKTDYKSAFKQLYTAHFKMVEYLVIKNSGSKADAEDIFQDTMIVIFDKSREEGFELSCALPTFVYSVARNLWLKKLRTNTKKVSITDYENYIPVSINDEQMDDTALEEKIRSSINKLGDNCRKILTLFYYQKMNMQQIAAELGYTNADNAKNQKYKCLQQLKTYVTANNA